MRDKIFVDSNILIYLVDKDEAKKVISILKPSFYLSTQVIIENLNVGLKKLKLNKEDSYNHAEQLIKRFNVCIINPTTIRNKKHLNEQLFPQLLG